MKKPNKWVLAHVVQGNYGQGWEDVAASDKLSEAKANRREHQTNQPEYPCRIVHRRVLREKYERGEF